MVGRASVPGLLEIAGERLRDEHPVLPGDPDFFRRLSVRQRREAKELTAYYGGHGPRPQTAKLAALLVWERFQAVLLMPLSIFRNRNSSIMTWLNGPGR